MYSTRSKPLCSTSLSASNSWTSVSRRAAIHTKGFHHIRARSASIASRSAEWRWRMWLASWARMAGSSHSGDWSHT